MIKGSIPGAGGVRLAYDRGGEVDGQPLILLHGGGQTRGSWGTLAHSLVAEGYHVISLDLRGHGESQWSPDGDYSFSTYRDDLRSLIASLGRPPVLVGASLGGLASLLTVGEGGGDEAVALVLVDITPWIDEAETSRIAQFMLSRPQGFTDLADAAAAVAEYLPYRSRPDKLGGLLRNLRQSSTGRLQWHWDPAMMDPANRPSAADLSDRLEIAARNVRIPTLLVRGELSRIVTREHAEAMRDIVAGLRVVEVAGAGHMIAGDSNDAFDAAILAFLGDVAPADPER